MEYNERIQNAKTLFEIAVDKYIILFCEKYELDYDEASMSWVGGRIGEQCCIADYCINFDDIRYMIDNSIKWDIFVRWYDYNLRVSMIDSSISTPNLKSWYKECPRLSESELISLEESKARIDKLKEELQEQIKNTHF